MSEREKNFITPDGAKRLQEELYRLRNVERVEVVKTVAWAASNGDRSENADYIYGKRRLRQIDSRIRFLSSRLEKAVVVDPAQQKSEQALFGATVRIANERGEEKTFQIVGVDEAEAEKGRISWQSPMGRALLGAKTGDIRTLRTPRGDEEIEILEIFYR